MKKINKVIIISIILIIFIGFSHTVCLGTDYSDDPYAFQNKIGKAISIIQIVGFGIMIFVLFDGITRSIYYKIKMNGQSKDNPYSEEEKAKLEKMKNRGKKELIGLIIFVVIAYISSYFLMIFGPTHHNDYVYPVENQVRSTYENFN